MGYIDTQLFINGKWQDAAEGRTLPVFNPATGKEIGRVAHAGRPDLDRALAAAQKGFEVWRDMRAAERSKIMRKAAALMRERAGDIAPLLTQEQGKPLAEAKGEAMAAADIIEWFADEGFRVYGRIVPSRINLAIRQMVLKDPVGPGRGVHALELPDQPGGAQGRRRARRRLLDARQGAGRDARRAGRADPGLRRRRPAAGRARPGVRQPGRDLELPDPAPGDPQDHLHRLDAGGQAARGAGRPAHEARRPWSWAATRR